MNLQGFDLSGSVLADPPDADADPPDPDADPADPDAEPPENLLIHGDDPVARGAGIAIQGSVDRDLIIAEYLVMTPDGRLDRGVIMLFRISPR